MSLRQVYYQLVARQVIENCENSYKELSRLLVEARRAGVIPYAWIEDRTRRAHVRGHGFSDPSEYVEMLKASAAVGYRRDVWEGQSEYVEVWVEKDALSGLFLDALGPYGLTLNVGKGFSSASEMYLVAKRLRAEAQRTGRTPIMLYFGDFDPSGEAMVHDLRDRLREDFACTLDLSKKALTLEQVEQYNLPPDLTKKTDTRARRHIERYGDIAVELDALPPDVLRQMITAAVESVLDLNALRELREQEEREREALRKALLAAYDGISIA